MIHDQRKPLIFKSGKGRTGRNRASHKEPVSIEAYRRYANVLVDPDVSAAKEEERRRRLAARDLALADYHARHPGRESLMEILLAAQRKMERAPPGR